MKHLRLISLAVVIAMLLSSFPLVSAAFGTADKKMAITHINTSATTEGSSIIMTPAAGDTVGAFGTFDWWGVYVFDWDAAEKVYKVVTVNRAAPSNKSKLEIPDTGFAIGINAGNNYPELYEKDHNSAYKDKPNYRSEMIVNSIGVANTLKVGTKVYLYGVNIKSGFIKTNGATWYLPEFVTDSFIKVGEPEATGTPYDPENAVEERPQYTLVPTEIDKVTYASGECLLFTGNYGDSILPVSATSYTYDWWKVLVCDWDVTDSCYKVISLNKVIGNSTPKMAVIPDNGFVIADCGSVGGGNIDSVLVGDKVFVNNIDLASGKLNSGAEIVFNANKDGATPFTPTINNRLPAVNISGMSEKKTVCTKETGFKLDWADVSGASKYLVAINEANQTADGKLILLETVTASEYTIPGSMLFEGSTYTVTVIARGSAASASEPIRKTLACVSKAAMESSLVDKTVVAFGDSLTARSGYVQMLYGYIGTEVINAGVGGDSTHHARARFQADVLDLDPDIVTICFGMNDQAFAIAADRSNVTLDLYISNMEYMITELQKIGTDVILVTPNPVCIESGYYTPGGYGLDYGRPEIMDAYCAAIRSLAFKYKCMLVDMHAEFDANGTTSIYNAGDGIHQSQEGHRLYAECIGNALNAIYNDMDKATLTITCKDDSGEVISSHQIIGAKGARIIATPPALTNYTTSAAAKNVVLGTDTEVTFEYANSAYSIIAKAGTKAEVNGQYLNLGKAQTTESELLAMLETKGVVITPYNAKSGYIGTGSKLKLMNGSETVCELTVVQLGDTNGDGKIDAIDYLTIKRACLQMVTLQSAFHAAACTGGGTKITATDYLRIKRHVLHLYNLYA